MELFPTAFDADEPEDESGKVDPESRKSIEDALEY